MINIYHYRLYQVTNSEGCALNSVWLLSVSWVCLWRWRVVNILEKTKEGRRSTVAVIANRMMAWQGDTSQQSLLQFLREFELAPFISRVQSVILANELKMMRMLQILYLYITFFPSRTDRKMFLQQQILQNTNKVIDTPELMRINRFTMKVSLSSLRNIKTEQKTRVNAQQTPQRQSKNLATFPKIIGGLTSFTSKKKQSPCQYNNPTVSRSPFSNYTNMISEILYHLYSWFCMISQVLFSDASWKSAIEKMMLPISISRKIILRRFTLIFRRRLCSYSVSSLSFLQSFSYRQLTSDPQRMTAARKRPIIQEMRSQKPRQSRQGIWH